MFYPLYNNSTLYYLFWRYLDGKNKCIGGLLGAQVSKRAGHRIALIIAGILSLIGFILTASLHDSSIIILYISYGILAGTGIGIAYNVIIATVSAWFPDKKGLCSGCLMKGFGASALILGNIANTLCYLDHLWDVVNP